MKLVRLFWRLLRYRVAGMLVLFLLLAAAIHGAVQNHPWPLTIAAAALAFSYVSATSVNDLADQKIDAINHPESYGRPLITADAKPRDMWLLFALSSIMAVVLASLTGYLSAIILFGSIVINVLYSLPPIRLSYRTFLAPLALGLAYVGVPYCLALAVTHSTATASDGRWLVGLYVLFVGRIILKDFRDRRGDARYHKPTFLLRFGKEATCIVSLAGLIDGSLIVVLQVLHTLWLATLVLGYTTSIAIMLQALKQTKPGPAEQIYIGVGARMGNGLLLTLLTALTLQTNHAPLGSQIAITLIVSSVFFGSYLNFLHAPERATIGYKG